MLQTTPNLRDIGRTPTVDGALIRPERVLRSGLPFDDDVVDHVVWPPRLVLDLRSDHEITQQATLSTAPSRNLPLLASLKPEAHHDGTLVTLYGALLESAGPMLVDVVRSVTYTDGPVLIHCAAGKDRTGISVALLMRLAGVERSTVMADYVLTNDAIGAIDQRLRQLPGNERRSELPREYFHVVPDALDAVMDVWDAHPDGTHGWLRSVGAEADLADRLRESLLE